MRDNRARFCRFANENVAVDGVGSQKRGRGRGRKQKKNVTDGCDLGAALEYIRGQVPDRDTRRRLAQEKPAPLFSTEAILA